MDSAKERGEVIEFIKNMKLKSKAIGGADRDDVFEKIKGLTEIYEGIISKETIEQQAVIERLEKEIAQKDKKLEEKAIEQALIDGDRVVIKGYDNGALDDKVKQLENEKAQLISEKAQLTKSLENARAQIQVIKNGDINTDTSTLDAERARVKALIFEAREKAANLLKETKVKAEELVQSAKKQSQQIIEKSSLEAEENTKRANAAKAIVAETSEQIKQLKADAEAYHQQSLSAQSDTKSAKSELSEIQNMLQKAKSEFDGINVQKQQAQNELDSIQLKLSQLRDMFGITGPVPAPVQQEKEHPVSDMNDVFENPKYSQEQPSSIDSALKQAKDNYNQPDNYESDVATPEDFALFEDELAKYDEELSRLESMSTL